AVVARGGSEEEDLLARGLDPCPNGFAEDPREPGAAGEDVRVRRERGSVREQDPGERAVLDRAGGRLGRTVIAPLGQESLDDERARLASEEIPGLLLEERPLHALEGDLGIAPRRLIQRQLLVRKAVVPQDRERVRDVLPLVAQHPER